ncbi:MAG: 3' terminal RNA ribose 2'-O-methyltransferase Hen1, partial [Chloroflexota bacterium]|nr:3' terminal RNA ribose 2'-O-methyltransferase Hen1 [Chloroflexota bacterium]
MLLTISTTHQPATDLGYLLHKNPGRLQSFTLPFGRAYVFYPVADAERCTAALLLDIDPVGLVRSGAGASSSGGWLQQYVNDRPYVASSYLSVAIASVFSSALSGNSRERPELAQQAIPLEAQLPTLPSREGDALIRRLFEPLGYSVEIQEHPLDAGFPEWGASPCFGVSLEGVVKLRDLLAHLYVLLPVLDDAKHYWVGDDEVDKLLRFGAGWLVQHPHQELISARYLKRQRSLVRQALDRLSDDVQADPDGAAERGQHDEERLETPLRLGEQRMQAVLVALREVGATRVLDLGCGEGNLLGEMLKEPAFQAIAGMDVSHRALETAHSRLRLDNLPTAQRERVSLLQGSLTYQDKRLAGFDAAVAMEVIEHIEPERMEAFEAAVFGAAHPGAVIITTPNSEYNGLFENLPSGEFRHRDHRFEWTRNQFQDWARGVASRRGYEARFQGIGSEHPVHGAPTQMG